MSSFMTDTASKIIVAVAGTSIVGLGTAVISSTGVNSSQEVKLVEMKERAEKTDGALQRLDESVRALDKSVAVLNERLRKE